MVWASKRRVSIDRMIAADIPSNAPKSKNKKKLARGSQERKKNEPR